jgi:hypothetical protein
MTLRSQPTRKISRVGGAAVPGRLEVAGTEARPTGLFSYKAKDLVVTGIYEILRSLRSLSMTGVGTFAEVGSI